MAHSQPAHAQPIGYLAVPASGQGSGVLVLHAWWGLNEPIKAFCERLAGKGFIAFAPDLYDGKVAQTIADAEALAQALFGRSQQAEAELAKAVAFLRERVGEPNAGLAVIGFSLGAYYALDLSASAPEHVRAVVIFYGTGGSDFGASKAEYLAHFAEDDEFEPQENLDALQEALAQAGRPLTLYQYPGTGHWFFEPDRVQAYNEGAAQLAWERTLAFLQRFVTS